MTANPLSTIPPIGPTTGMTPPPQGGRFKPVDPVRLLRQHVLLLAITGVVGLVVGGGLYALLLKTSPQYTSEAQLVLDNRIITEGLQIAATASAQTDVERQIMNEVNFIQSDEIIRTALDRPAAQQSAWFRGFNNNTTAARQEMQQDMFSANMIRGTSLINIQMTAPNPADARDLLEAVLDTYLTNKRLAKNQANLDLRKVVMANRDRADDEIRNLKRQIDRFISDNELGSLQVNASDAQRTYDTQLAQSLDLGFQLAAAQGMYEGLKRSGAEGAVSDRENAMLKQMPSIASRQEQLIALAERRRSLLAEGKGENHPMVEQVENMREAVRIELDRETAKEVAELRALNLQLAASEVESLTAQIEGLRAPLEVSSLRLQELNQKLTEYHSLNTDLEIAMEKSQIASAALDNINTINERDESVQVSRQVSPTDAELTSPKWVLIPMVAFLFLGVVGGVVVLREMLDQRVRSPQDLKLMPEANLLGLIPHQDEDLSGNGSAQRTVERSPTGLLAESYRQVRTAVLAKMDRRGYKTLVCVSALPEAGTSTVVQNLAMSLAFNGRSVLIIDANFRRPAQHTLMDVPNDRGLVDVLKDRAGVDDVLVNHADASLSLLPSGKAADAPPELLEGSAFRGLLGQLESQFDIILIDAPPALLTSDSQLLSKHVDAIAVVVKAGSDKRGMLSRMLGQLDGQRADVLGVILSGVESAAGGYFRKSYEEFYRYRQADTLNTQRSKTKAPKASKTAKPSKTTAPGSVPGSAPDNTPGETNGHANGATRPAAATAAPKLKGATTKESKAKKPEPELDDDFDFDLDADLNEPRK